MSFQDTDMGYFFSTGGGPGTARTANLGGAIGTTEIVDATYQNFTPDVTRQMLGTVGTTGTWHLYFPFYLKNKNATTQVTAVQVWVEVNISDPNLGIQLGKDPAGLNGTATTIANQTTAPTNVVFDDPYQYTFGYLIGTTYWSIGTMAAGNTFPMWVHLYGKKGLASIPQVWYELQTDFTR